MNCVKTLCWDSPTFGNKQGPPHQRQSFLTPRLHNIVGPTTHRVPVSKVLQIMRAFALLATICAATIGATSALVGINDMISGCSPNCTAVDMRVSYDNPEAYYQCCENTLDVGTSADSRWSCEGDECCIKYFFEDPQDVDKMRIAFHKGDERIRTLDVFDNGRFHSKITSSGNTLGYETFYLYTDETDDIELCLDGDDDEWISITEVRFYAQ